jgi:hypothetical protein
MDIFARRRSPQPLELPFSRRELAGQVTMVDLPALPPSAYCRCGHVIDPGARFCGSCGSRLRNAWYVRGTTVVR